MESAPGFRLFGNLLLTVLTRIASGYWSVVDSQNGYTAISVDALESIDLEEMYEFYGYCNDLLVKLNVEESVVADVPTTIIYEDETSHINYLTYVPRVAGMLLRNFLWRLKEKYLLGDFHPLVLLYAVGAVGGAMTVLRALDALRSRHSGTARGLLTGAVVSVLSLGWAMALDRRENEHLAYEAPADEGTEPRTRP